MNMSAPKYQIGNTVYHAYVRETSGRFDCPDCMGTKVWDITSPAGQPMQMDCPRCQKETYRDELSLKYYTYAPGTRKLTIGSIRMDTADKDSLYEYMCVETGVGSGSVYKESDLHPTEEIATQVATLQAAPKIEAAAATPKAMERVEYGRMGFFDAQREAASKEVRARVLNRISAEIAEGLAAGEHSPGRWVVKSSGVSDSGYYSFTIDAMQGNDEWECGSQICSGYGCLTTNFPSNEQGVANAYLISAAPDLLAALQRLDRDGHTQATWDFAKQAMDKAAGKVPETTQ